MAAPLIPGKRSVAYGRPSVFLFSLLLVLRWLSLGFGRDKPVLGFTAVCQLAFTAAPPLFMALLLTTRPRQGLFAPAAGVGVACGRPAGRAVRSAAGLVDVADFGPISRIEAVAPREPPVDRSTAIRRRSIHQLLSGAGGAAGAMRRTGFSRLYPDGPGRRFHPWTAVFLTKLSLCPISDERIPVCSRFCSRRHPGPARVENRQRYGADGLSSRLQPLFHRPIYVSPRIRAWNAEASGMSQPDLLAGAIALAPYSPPGC